MGASRQELRDQEEEGGPPESVNLSHMHDGLLLPELEACSVSDDLAATLQVLARDEKAVSPFGQGHGLSWNFL